MGATIYYKDLNYKDIKALDRDKTIFLWAISPIEVHGPHLPVDTDVIIAEELQKRYIEALSKKYTDYIYVILPSLYVGANALPVKGSLSVSSKALEEIVLCYGKGLAQQGFKYLFISDNHGGPGHQLGIQSACQRLWKKYRFYAIDPFGEVFRLMVENQQSFMEMTKLKKGYCGDDEDSHAGTNETSLMLASAPDKVKEEYKITPPSLPPKIKGGAVLVSTISKMVGFLGGKETSRDLVHLANTLAWVGDKNMLPYMGKPSEASVEAGEAMLRARVNIAMELFDRAIEGKTIKIRPILWSLKILRKLPE